MFEALVLVQPSRNKKDVSFRFGKNDFFLLIQDQTENIPEVSGHFFDMF